MRIVSIDLRHEPGPLQGRAFFRCRLPGNFFLKTRHKALYVAFLNPCQWVIFGRERSRHGPAVRHWRAGLDRGSQRPIDDPHADRLHTAVQALQRVMNDLQDEHATAGELLDALG